MTAMGWPSGRCLHHFVSRPAKEEGIGLVVVPGHGTMQVFVREHLTMIAAPVQGDADGIPKGSHDLGAAPTLLLGAGVAVLLSLHLPTAVSRP
jgi:hypothetical protein